MGTVQCESLSLTCLPCYTLLLGESKQVTSRILVNQVMQTKDTKLAAPDAAAMMKRLGISPQPWGGLSSTAIDSSNTVLTSADSEPVPASHITHVMLIKDSFTGFQFQGYEDDIMFIYNGGASTVIHIIHPDGTYEKQVLGDVIRDPNAKYMVSVPGQSYSASEIQGEAGDYSILTMVAAPMYSFAKIIPQPPNQDNTDTLLSQFPQHQELIQRLKNIRKDDKEQ